MLLILAAAVALWYLSKTGTKGASLPSQGAQQTTTNGLDNITEAIARYEGFYTPGSVAQRTNNPGNIGTYGGNQTSYADSGDGWTALQSWVTSHAATHPDWSIAQMMTDYLTGSPTGTPGPKQNPAAYAGYVADYIGTTPDTPVLQVLQS